MQQLLQQRRGVEDAAASAGEGPDRRLRVERLDPRAAAAAECMHEPRGNPEGPLGRQHPATGLLVQHHHARARGQQLALAVAVPPRFALRREGIGEPDCGCLGPVRLLVHAALLP